MNPISRDNKTFWFLAILILAFLLRIYDLSGESIWLDEGRSVSVARMSIPALITENSQDNHPPLYSILLHYWMLLFGYSEFSTRFLSVIFSVLSLCILYQIGVNIFNRQIAWFSALLMTVSVFHIQYAQEIKSYALMLLLILLSYLFFIRILIKQRMADMVLYVIATVLLLYTHFLGISTILAQVIYLLACFFMGDRFKPRYRTSWILIYIFIFILFLPWFGFLLSRTLDLQQNFWVKKPDLFSLPQVLLIYSGTYTPCGIAALVISLLLILLSVWPKKKTTESHPESIAYPGLLLSSWFLVPLLVPFIISLFSASIFMARITIGALPAFLLLVTIGLSNLNKPIVEKITLAILVILSLINVIIYYQEINKERWREAVTFVESNAHSGDLIIIHEEYCLVNAFDYYARREDLVKTGFPPAGKIINSETITGLQNLTTSNDRVWLVISHSHDPDNLIISHLQNWFQLNLHQSYESRGFNSHQPYNGVELYHFQKLP
jgi:mannosyltransferase